MGFSFKAEILQMINMSLGLRIRRNDGPTLKSVKNLGGVKTDCRQVPMTKDAPPFIKYPKRMGSVVNQPQIVFFGNVADLRHIAGTAIAMNR